MSFTKSIVSILLLSLLGSVASAQNKPNVIYILVDNWGWGDIALQGGTIPTPRIDELASQGTRLTNFNVQNQCTPTRSAIHTGRLPIRSGTQKVPAPGETRELWQSEGYSHLWVMKPVMEILSELASSQQQYPNIKPGQEFSGYD